MQSFPTKNDSAFKGVPKIRYKLCRTRYLLYHRSPFPIQLLVTKELNPNENRWLQSLRNDVTKPEEIKTLLKEYEDNKSSKLYQAAIDVITRANWNAVKEVKAGKIDFKVDKTGIIHTAIGKASFTPEQIYDNAKVVMSAIMKLKPQTLKGTYLKGAAICTTMSPGIKLDIKSFSAE